MPRFSTRLAKIQTFGAPAQQLPTDLQITPISWSANDRGGCYQAEFSASGSAESLATLTGWLGDRIEIYNEMGQLLWWGDVWDIEIILDHIDIRLSMDNVYNRVQVIYPQVLPDGTEISARTDWVENSNSITLYGTRELLHSLSSALGTNADHVRNQLLEKFAYPGPIVSSRRDTGFSARLIGQGTWYKASSIYFTNLKGLVEYTEENGQQTLGRSINSTAIQFGVIDTEPDPDELVDGDEMTIGGGGSFYPLQVDDAFTITGAVATDDEGRTNNESHLIDAIPDPTKIIISGAFIAEAAGPNIQVSWGYNPSVTFLAQSFEVPVGWTATHVAIKCRQLRNMADPDNPISPSDYLLVGIYEDAGSGLVGDLLGYENRLGASLYTELTWTEFVLNTPVPLTGGVTYIIGIRRSGAGGETITPHLEDGYEFAVNELEGNDQGYVDGKLMVYGYAGWAERNPRADLSFRVIGEIDSSEQMVEAIESVDSFFNDIVKLETGIPIRPYRDDGRTAMDELQELLEAGTDDGKRLIAYLMPDRSVVIDVARPIEESEFTLGSDGRMRYANGSEIQPGQLVYGQHVRLDTLLLLDGVGLRLEAGRSLYVQGSSYDAASDSLMVQGLGSLDPYSALRIAQG